MSNFDDASRPSFLFWKTDATSTRRLTWTSRRSLLACPKCGIRSSKLLHEHGQLVSAVVAAPFPVRGS
jgi:hypothetical protein